ncbi:PREDICTED: uncharacterized protein LOC108761750 [Trachymyrmex cornetzi]|uniref:uncharacterized protein LOC108761750 n=1 Tax=Trachymyrmex cornetzi TaxID=471704 RepID=UPI00084F80E0|nr:PREDICTED: uncharacterized protein LOC108761750 [Trachymyrmex cornetzi]
MDVQKKLAQQFDISKSIDQVSVEKSSEAMLRRRRMADHITLLFLSIATSFACSNSHRTTLGIDEKISTSEQSDPSHQPTAIILQFSFVGITGIAEVFLYTWPAEHLMYMSKDVAQTAFYMLKDIHLIEVWKCLQIIIMRSQKPIIVSIPCFLPELSLSYFTSYLSTILSYFTTLRVMMDDDNNN